MKHLSLQLLSAEGLDFRLQRIYQLMDKNGVDALIVSNNNNKYYLTGRIFDGWIVIDRLRRGMSFFLRRQSELTGENVYNVRKLEDIPEVMNTKGVMPNGNIAMELNETPYAIIDRLCKAFGIVNPKNADAILMEARAVKADDEIAKIRESADKHDRVYRQIPRMYREGMTDVELQIEIERVTRQEGALGIMRVSGSDMEINMGSVLAGANADTPSPYDFALGGAGTSPALPVGANGTIIQPGMTVMVDTNGDFNGYMTDMTRTFTVDSNVSEEVRMAHQVSIDICRCLEKEGRPGVACADLYNIAVDMATAAGLADKFMGAKHQAGFIGHGVGITINELPVLAPRSKSVLELNNIIAIEPKFVMERVGAVGIENTYRVTAQGLEKLTVTPEELITLEN